MKEEEKKNEPVRIIQDMKLNLLQVNGRKKKNKR
jgi:hypothetical protein